MISHRYNPFKPLEPLPQQQLLLYRHFIKLSTSNYKKKHPSLPLSILQPPPPSRCLYHIGNKSTTNLLTEVTPIEPSSSLSLYSPHIVSVKTLHHPVEQNKKPAQSTTRYLLNPSLSDPQHVYQAKIFNSPHARTSIHQDWN